MHNPSVWQAVLSAMRPVIALGILAATACSSGGLAPKSTIAAARPHEDSTAPRPVPGARFVFLFVGDGMGAPQIRAAELFRATAAARARPAELAFTRFPVQEMVTSHAAGADVTDSAAAGTALASGHKTALGMLGLLPDGATPVESVAEAAHAQGRRVGIITTVSLDHATPAAFYAHHPDRHDYAAIALQAPTSRFDYFAGGGFLGGVDDAVAERAIWESIRRHGYHVASDRAAQDSVELPAFVINERLDSDAAMPYELDRSPHEKRLADYTRQAIDLLESEAGFFLMVEGGKIDWACHANDGATSIHETLELSAAIEQAVTFMDRHPHETLVVVTADHETGGMVLAPDARESVGRLRRQKASARRFQSLVVEALGEHPQATLEDLEGLLEVYWGLRLDDELRAALNASRARIEGHRLAGTLRLADTEPDEFTAALTRAFDRRAGIQWTSSQHTAAPVPVYVDGAGRERFESVQDNADVGRLLLELVGGQQ